MEISFKILSNRVKILNSYQITNKKEMKSILTNFLKEHSEIKFDRSIDLLVKEWVVHNRMYKLGIKRDKTKDVDLEFNEKECYKLLYWILGI